MTDIDRAAMDYIEGRDRGPSARGGGGPGTTPAGRVADESPATLSSSAARTTGARSALAAVPTSGLTDGTEGGRNTGGGHVTGPTIDSETLEKGGAGEGTIHAEPNEPVPPLEDDGRVAPDIAIPAFLRRAG